MTKVKIERGERRVTIEVTGHSNYKGRPDVDLVCSAASMLASTLAQHAQKLVAADVIEEMVGFEYIPERVYVDYLIKDKPICVVVGHALAETIQTGYEMLQEQYPKNVKILR